jgi:predicted nucleic acid-binding protein
VIAPAEDQHGQHRGHEERDEPAQDDRVEILQRRMGPSPRPAWLEDYRVRAVDASVICAVVFAEPEAEAALQRIRHHALVAPDLLPYEVSNVALMKHRRGAPMPDMRAGLVRCLELELLLEPTDALQRLEIAARYGLSAYDAAYLWLAEATQAPLITFDARLAEAARRHLGPQGHGATQ